MTDIQQGIRSGLAPMRLPLQPAQPKQEGFPSADQSVVTPLPANDQPITRYNPPSETQQSTSTEAQPQPQQQDQYSPPQQENHQENHYQPSQPEAEDNQYFPEELRPQPERLLLEWEAPNRPFKKRNKQYYTTIAIIVFLISLILFFAGQFLPIAVVIAVGFLAYVLSAVPPEQIKNEFTTYGIRTDNQLYYWDELGRFWFTEKHKQPLLHVEVARFPNQLTLLLGNLDQEDLRYILSQVLLEEQPLPTAFDNAAAWLQEKIPLDTDS